MAIEFDEVVSFWQCLECGCLGLGRIWTQIALFDACLLLRCLRFVGFQDLSYPDESVGSDDFGWQMGFCSRAFLPRPLIAGYI